ncbi:hypothetical protein [Spirosoma oryzicola]|uniref:hypothetical protein n=1 Tax=Spirosoma oryzicola TaxID=2898794 RepID=UPI001E336545|nr:hypothetical protein [Spirosoma oryzicola]UHG93350.1 hypothetical protein LQ777_10700 [Spirosoma oryzicola]
MISLKLTRLEFQVMVQFLRWHTEYQNQVPLVHQSTNMIILMDYLATWNTLRLLNWSCRQPDKEYRLGLKRVIALALHQEMLRVKLTVHQQILLGKLDQAIVDYRDPFAEPHVIGELIDK